MCVSAYPYAPYAHKHIYLSISISIFHIHVFTCAYNGTFFVSRLMLAGK